MSRQTKVSSFWSFCFLRSVPRGPRARAGIAAALALALTSRAPSAGAKPATAARQQPLLWHVLYADSRKQRLCAAAVALTTKAPELAWLHASFKMELACRSAEALITIAMPMRCILRQGPEFIRNTTNTA